MSRRFSVLLVLCVALFGAILAGYWDLLSSQPQSRGGEAVAEGASAPTPAQPSEAPATASPPAAAEAPAAGSAPAPAPTAPETRTASNTPTPSQAGTPSPAMSDAPRFDLLRVEPDGSAVIAGQAAADSEVRILSGDKQVGRATASRDGDFALVLDERLTVGSHSIRIEALRPDGRTEASQEIAVVSVPRPGKPGDLLAMIEQPGQPSRIIAAPKAEAAPVSTDAGVSATGGPAVPEQQASIAPASATPATATGEPAPQPFAVEAVEIENGTIYIAGRADGKEPVRVYVDEKLVGEDRNRANGRFLVTAEAPLAQGEHRIRADIVGSDGKVASRVEVPFTKPESETMSAMASDGPASVPAAPAAGAEAQSPAGGADTPVPDAAPTTTAQGDAGVGTVVQPALQAVDARVLIRRGDTLWRISRETYGFGRRYTVIYLANGDQLRNPNRIYPGQLLRVPKHENETPTR